MKDINDFRNYLQQCIDSLRNHRQKSWGIFYKGERVNFTNTDIVDYSSKKKAFDAMLKHGNYKHAMSKYTPGQGYNHDLYVDAVLELLRNGELEIKQLT